MTFSKLGTDTETHQPVYLPKASRTKGVYILGLQGSGKSGLIENLCIEDGKQGTGFCVIDPHGELIDNVISRLPVNREQDVIYLDIHDYHHPFGLNLFTCSDPSNPLAVQEVVDQVMHVFEMLVDVTPTTPQILDYLRNCTNVLVANPGYTMAEVTLLLKNRTCREKLLQHVSDLSVLSFWHDYFDQMPASEQRSESISLERRVRHFLQPLTVNIVGQSKSSIDFRFVMDEAKILLVKLDSLRLRGITQLIGALIISLFLNAAPSRTRGNLFNIYADEFPLYATEDFVTLIEQARKRHIGLAMAHQNRGQLDARVSLVASKLRDRTLGTKQKIIFAITFQDADDDIAGEFDTTPPPPKQEEATRRAIQTPVSNPIQWLLSGKTHTNPTVNTFISKWNMRKIEQLRQGKGRYSSPEILRKEATQFLDTVNTLCYQAMIYKNPDILSFPASFLQLMQSLHEELFDVKYGEQRHHINYYIGYILTVVLGNQTQQMTLSWLLNLLTSSQQSTLIDRGFHKKVLLDYLKLIIQEVRSDTNIQSLLEEYFRYEPYTNTGWFVIHHLQWEQTVEEQISGILGVGTSGQTYYKHKQVIVPRLVQGQETNWYTPYALEQEIDRIMASPSSSIPKQCVVSFLSDLLAMLRVLAVEPIEEDSGRQEIVYRPGPVRPYADIKNDIANQLSGLPNYTARVKLDDTFPQNPGKKCLNCGLLNNAGTLFCTGCGTKLPAPNEYTIETIRPTGYMGTHQLQQRIQGIQTRNRQKLYCRSKKDVEAEISKRQTGCSGGAAPAQPQQPQPQQTRHARQVPVPGHCPKCNATNPRGAKFCNQCGSPI